MVSRLHAVLACTGRDAAGSNDHVQMANDDQMLRLNPALYTLSRLRNISLREEDPGKKMPLLYTVCHVQTNTRCTAIYILSAVRMEDGVKNTAFKTNALLQTVQF